MNVSKIRLLDDAITVREWKAPESLDNGEAVILLHGIESHSEWFEDIAQRICNAGYSVLAYDRAGWGMSSGIRGHIPSYRHILKQLTLLSASMRKNHSKVHLVGLSWGGMFALYATLRRRVFFDSLGMIAPGIFPRGSFTPKAKMNITTAIIGKKYEKDFPLLINTDDFTRDEEYKSYIIGDPLRNTRITASTAFETLKMQQFCKESVSLRELPPTVLILAGDDNIIKNDLTLELFKDSDIHVEEIPKKMHSLVFEAPEETTKVLLENFRRQKTNVAQVKPKVLIMGAGAVGSIVGGKLALGGSDVTLVGRKKHVDAVNDQGLSISLGGVERTGIKDGLKAVENVSDLSGEFDLIIISVKSFDTPTVLSDLQPIITPSTVLMSLQNGVSNEAVIYETYPENTVLAGIICMNLNFSKPGLIECSDDKGGISIGLHSGSHQLAKKSVKMLRGSGMQVDYFPKDSKRIKWSKMLLNISSNVLNAITGLSYRDILSDKRYGTLAVNAIKETFIIMRKEGIEPIKLPGYNVQALAKLCKAPNFITRQVLIKLADDGENTVTSMQQDLNKIRMTSAGSEKRKPTELHELNGKIVMLGEKHNVPTPANSELCRLLEKQAKQLQPQN